MCHFGLCESLKTVAIIVSLYRKLIPIFYFSVEHKWAAKGGGQAANGGSVPPALVSSLGADPVVADIKNKKRATVVWILWT